MLALEMMGLLIGYELRVMSHASNAKYDFLTFYVPAPW